MKPAMFYKRATNTDIQRYLIADRGEYILYPQSATSFAALPAGMRRHLSAHEKELKQRAAYRRGDCEWWKFTWPLHEQYYDRQRILCPYLATSNRFAIDALGTFLSLTDTTVLFENGQPESMLYLLALLNSKLLTFRFKTIGKLKSGGILEYFWNQISKLPIRRIDFADSKDKARHDHLALLAEKLMETAEHLANAKTDRLLDFYGSKFTGLDREVDSLVYELYGLSSDEVALIEGTERLRKPSQR